MLGRARPWVLAASTSLVAACGQLVGLGDFHASGGAGGAASNGSTSSSSGGASTSSSSRSSSSSSSSSKATVTTATSAATGGSGGVGGASVASSASASSATTSSGGCKVLGEPCTVDGDCCMGSCVTFSDGTNTGQACSMCDDTFACGPASLPWSVEDSWACPAGSHTATFGVDCTASCGHCKAGACSTCASQKDCTQGGSCDLEATPTFCACDGTLVVTEKCTLSKQCKSDCCCEDTNRCVDTGCGCL